MADSGDQRRETQSGGASVINFFKNQGVESVLWISRMLTLTFTFLFILPLASDPNQSYQKALLCNAATSALRLHQRLPRFQFNQAYFSALFLEDSCHYLLYSFLLFMAHPISLALIPISLYAALHATSFSLNMLNHLTAAGSLQPIRQLLGKLNSNQTTILRFIAACEIFLVFIIIIMILSGRASLLMPFLYYRFLCLRYASGRNPYCRQAFAELRMTVERVIADGRLPAVLGRILQKAIDITCRLAPPVPSS